MKNLNATISNDKRSIAVSYKTIDEEYDGKIFHKIMEIVRKMDLSCTTTKVSNGRCFHIAGISSKNVEKAYNEIEKLD